MFPDNIIEACFKQVCHTLDCSISLFFDHTFTCFHAFFRRIFLFQTKTEQIPVEIERNVTVNVSDPGTGGTIEVFNGTESMFKK